MRLFIVDAFTEEVFGGNPAGVVLLDSGSKFPDEEIMQKTAAELRYSETVFIKPETNNLLHLRYFTQYAEVDFCGHATIGAFTALLKAGLVVSDSSYLIHTLSGDLTITMDGDSVLMEMPPSKLIKHITSRAETDELCKSLGIKWEPITANGQNLLPIYISTGFPDIILPVKSRDVLASIDPDYKYLSALSKKHEVGGVHVFTLDAPEGITACCRNFAPLYRIHEEAATGTANGGLTYYLHIHGLAPPGYNCCFLQGEAMGRPSKIITSIDIKDDKPVIKVGGKGAILADGKIYLG